MVQAVTVGLDIDKNVFHACGVDSLGQKTFSRKLRRAKVEAFFAKLEPCLIEIEACATAHHWARTFESIQVPLMPPASESHSGRGNAAVRGIKMTLTEVWWDLTSEIANC